ncbi:MAG: hypothetical protein GYB55_22965 [Cytophagales bacterium]|uniref:hypothetical protein n=1 Tax=Cyclobacterium marinum TaxID=104 RepID=UPI0030D89D3A|nr:hypothetical protein [Cytophagales bacterium]|tara:strand:- start:30610 stop:31218 length:609 start_codon:yes stop_codon:yes gene_type:complete
MLKYTLTAVLTLLLLGCYGLTYGQSYGTSAGLRLGNNDQGRMLGFTVQQRLKKGVTLEGIVQSDFSYNTTIHALLERHRPLLSKRLNYYYGAGASVGREESREKVSENMQIIRTYGNNTLGVDFIAGVELTLLGVNFSVDYKPNVNIVGRQPWYSGQVGISVRSVLVKGNKQNKKRRQKTRMKRKRNSDGFFHNLIDSFKNK